MKRRSDAGVPRIHGHTSKHSCTRTYRSWQMMVHRCTNPNADWWHRYGGRGIKVCERWRKFVNFLADMGERPDGKSLDRFPNRDGDYEPGNCRWATQAEQVANRDTVVYAPRYHDLTGATYGRWTVLKLHDTKPQPKWLCRCECGTERAVKAASLTQHVSASCGCLKNELTRAKNPVLIRWQRHREKQALAACGRGI
jgi:hypothetical protein